MEKENKSVDIDNPENKILFRKQVNYLLFGSNIEEINADNNLLEDNNSELLFKNVFLDKVKKSVEKYKDSGIIY
jgi:hypothetical protein